MKPTSRIGTNSGGTTRKYSNQVSLPSSHTAPEDLARTVFQDFSSYVLPVRNDNLDHYTTINGDVFTWNHAPNTDTSSGNHKTFFVNLTDIDEKKKEYLESHREVPNLEETMLSVNNYAKIFDKFVLRAYPINQGDKTVMYVLLEDVREVLKICLLKEGKEIADDELAFDAYTPDFAHPNFVHFAIPVSKIRNFIVGQGFKKVVITIIPDPLSTNENRRGRKSLAGFCSTDSNNNIFFTPTGLMYSLFKSLTGFRIQDSINDESEAEEVANYRKAFMETLVELSEVPMGCFINETWMDHFCKKVAPTGYLKQRFQQLGQFFAGQNFDGKIEWHQYKAEADKFGIKSYEANLIGEQFPVWLGFFFLTVGKIDMVFTEPSLFEIKLILIEELINRVEESRKPEIKQKMMVLLLLHLDNKAVLETSVVSKLINFGGESFFLASMKKANDSLVNKIVITKVSAEEEDFLCNFMFQSSAHQDKDMLFSSIKGTNIGDHWIQVLLRLMKQVALKFLEASNEISKAEALEPVNLQTREIKKIKQLPKCRASTEHQALETATPASPHLVRSDVKSKHTATPSESDAKKAEKVSKLLSAKQQPSKIKPIDKPQEETAPRALEELSAEKPSSSVLTKKTSFDLIATDKNTAQKNAELSRKVAPTTAPKPVPKVPGHKPLIHQSGAARTSGKPALSKPSEVPSPNSNNTELYDLRARILVLEEDCAKGQQEKKLTKNRMKKIEDQNCQLQDKLNKMNAEKEQQQKENVDLLRKQEATFKEEQAARERELNLEIIQLKEQVKSEQENTIQAKQQAAVLISQHEGYDVKLAKALSHHEEQKKQELHAKDREIEKLRRDVLRLRASLGPAASTCQPSSSSQSFSIPVEHNVLLQPSNPKNVDPASALAESKSVKENFESSESVRNCRAAIERLREATDLDSVRELCHTERSQLEEAISIRKATLDYNIKRIKETNDVSDMLPLANDPKLSEKFKAVYDKEMNRLKENAEIEKTCSMCSIEFKEGVKVARCKTCRKPVHFECQASWDSAQKKKRRPTTCIHCKGPMRIVQ